MCISALKASNECWPVPRESNIWSNTMLAVCHSILCSNSFHPYRVGWASRLESRGLRPRLLHSTALGRTSAKGLEVRGWRAGVC